jgi:hypothetical protein
MKILSLLAAVGLSCAVAQMSLAAEPAKTYAREPDGKGDPAAITCRHPQALPGKRVLGPAVCRSNADWAQFAKQGMTVSADGTALVPGEKYRSLNPAACGPAAPSASTTNAMGASSGARLC